MSYELSVQEKDGYLHFNVSGENTIQNVNSYLAEIARTCLEKDCSSILVEESLKGPGLNLLEIFKIADEGAQQAPSVICRIAYVDAIDQHSLKDMNFAATVACNRGLNVRVFRSVSEAEEWLRNPIGILSL